jgi:hypothetical protein
MEDYETDSMLENGSQETNLTGLYYDEPLYEPPVRNKHIAITTLLTS